MKTDRRHELQTNVLADWIGKHLQQMQGYSKTILAVILLVIAAAVGGALLIQDQSARSQASWNQFFQAFGERDPEALEVVASANQGTVAGVWARLAEADLQLAEGIGDLYTNRDNAKKNLADAELNYLAVEQAASEKLLRERAWFGLGQVYESLAALDKAKQYYGKLVSSSPDSALGKEAKKRSDALSDASTEKWYNWFANQTPRPPAIPGLQDRFGLPNDPRELDRISDRPDLSFPQFPSAAPTPDAAAPAADPAAPGPDLNSPAPGESPAPSESSETPEKPAAADPEKPATPDASEAPAEPTPSEATPSEATPSEPAASEPKPESNEAPAEGASAPGEAAPE